MPLSHQAPDRLPQNPLNPSGGWTWNVEKDALEEFTRVWMFGGVERAKLGFCNKWGRVPVLSAGRWRAIIGCACLRGREALE